MAINHIEHSWIEHPNKIQGSREFVQISVGMDISNGCTEHNLFRSWSNNFDKKYLEIGEHLQTVASFLFRMVYQSMHWQNYVYL